MKITDEIIISILKSTTSWISNLEIEEKICIVPVRCFLLNSSSDDPFANIRIDKDNASDMIHEVEEMITYRGGEPGSFVLPLVDKIIAISHWPYYQHPYMVRFGTKYADYNVFIDFHENIIFGRPSWEQPLNLSSVDPDVCIQLKNREDFVKK